MNALFDGFTFQAAMDILAAMFLLGGVVFMLIGAIGVVRLPDAYNRIHAVSICVTFGLVGMLLATCYHIGTLQVVVKAVVTIVFILVASPIGSHMLAKAAHHAGLPQWRRTLSDDLAEDKADTEMGIADDVRAPEAACSGDGGTRPLARERPAPEPAA